jgi:hypothetical protein
MNPCRCAHTPVLTLIRMHMANFADLFVSTIARVEPSEGPFRCDGFPPYQADAPCDTPPAMVGARAAFAATASTTVRGATTSAIPWAPRRT